MAIIKHVATNSYFPITEPSRSFPNSFVILTRRSDQEIAIISVLQSSELSFRYESNSLTHRNTETCMNLPVMNAGHACFNEVSLLKASSTNEDSDITKGSILHPVRAQLLDQLGEATHWSASSSATIASMEARSSR